MARRRAVATVAVLTAAALAVGAMPASAGFAQQAAATSTLGTTTLRPPTGLAASRTCHKLLLGLVTTLTMDVTLSWTASPDSWAGHEVLQLVSGAWVVEATIAPGGPTTWTANGLSNVQRTWQVRSVKGGWTAMSPSSVTTSTCPLL